MLGWMASGGLFRASHRPHKAFDFRVRRVLEARIPRRYE